MSFRLAEADPGTDTYPYDSGCYYRGESYGIYHVDDFRLGYVQGVLDRIRRHGARNVLLFSSPAIAVVFETLVRGVPEFSAALDEVNLYLESVRETTLGGNFNAADCRFVEDYARAIRERVAGGMRFDLILIPDAFGSPWGTDMTGASYTEITREFGVPVELVDWCLLYGREV